MDLWCSSLHFTLSHTVFQACQRYEPCSHRVVSIHAPKLTPHWQKILSPSHYFIIANIIQKLTHFNTSPSVLVRYRSVVSTFRRPHAGPHSLVHMIPSSASVSPYVLASLVNGRIQMTDHHVRLKSSTGRSFCWARKILANPARSGAPISSQTGQSWSGSDFVAGRHTFANPSALRDRTNTNLGLRLAQQEHMARERLDRIQSLEKQLHYEREPHEKSARELAQQVREVDTGLRAHIEATECKTAECDAQIVTLQGRLKQLNSSKKHGLDRVVEQTRVQATTAYSKWEAAAADQQTASSWSTVASLFGGHLELIKANREVLATLLSGLDHTLDSLRAQAHPC